MSRLDELVSELCPGGVSFRKLGDIADFNRGRWLKAEYLTPGDIPVVTSSRVVGAFHNVSNRRGATIVVASSGAYAGFVSLWKEPIYLSNAFSVDVRDPAVVKPEFLYVVLLSKQNDIHSRAAGGGVPNVYGSDLADIPIPVPPIEVQNEVVRVLDKFAALEAELEAELGARRKQFDHYREELYSFGLEGAGQVSVRTLGELGEFVRGNGLQKKDLTATGMPAIHYGQIFTKYGTFAELAISCVDPAFGMRLRHAQPGNLIIATTSENAADVCKAVAWLGASDLSFGGHSCAFRHSLDPLYIAYYFQTERFQNQKRSYVYGTKVKDIKLTDLARITVPVPEVETQRKIGQTLQTLESLVTESNSGLPAEIAARRKQYEHYREKLLTFKEADA